MSQLAPNITLRLDFLFVGPSKTGSTWIFDLLAEHPGVYVPQAKDLYFFDKYYEWGYAWYRRQFPGLDESLCTGELSHDYFSSPLALSRIARDFPKCKVICCLRDPFQRLLSSAAFIRRNGMGSDSISKMIDQFPELLEESLYAKHLSNVFERFPREQVLVLYFDDLEASPGEFASRIFQFLGVDETVQPAVINRVSNNKSVARVAVLSRIMKMGAISVRKLGYPNLVGRIKHNRIVRKLLYRPAKQAATIGKSDDQWLALSNEQDVAVVEAALTQDLQRLEQLLEKDLRHWYPRGK